MTYPNPVELYLMLLAALTTWAVCAWRAERALRRVQDPPPLPSGWRQGR